MARRHKVPIHLETPDKLLLGMTARQVLIVGLGLTLGYIVVQGVWTTWPNTVLLTFAAVCAVVILVASFAAAFIAPKKRGFEVWTVVVLNYCLLPKRYVWRPLPPERAEIVRPRQGKEDRD